MELLNIIKELVYLYHYVLMVYRVDIKNKKFTISSKNRLKL